MSQRPAPLLVLGTVIREAGGDVLEGALVCPERMCQAEYPIIDGIPFLVPSPRETVASQLGLIRARQDLSPFIESLLGDCEPPGSELMRNRDYLSAYGRAHYGDLDPTWPAKAGDGLVPPFRHMLGMLDKARPGSLADTEAAGAGPLSAGTTDAWPTGAEPTSVRPTGPWIDIGCSVGRLSFELAARTGDAVLGVDMNFAMLKLARQVAATGRVRHFVRRVGVVYEEREFAADLPGRERVDFWMCDARLLPFADGMFAGALSMNVLDSMPAPMVHLAELGRVLVPGAPALLTTPYDWTTAATPIEGWIGGHSQRSPLAGSSVAEMRRLLSPERQAGIDLGLTMVAEVDALPWRLYVHERATMEYQVHGILARAGAAHTA